jgi:hypothetical protein
MRSQFLPATSCPCFFSKAMTDDDDCDEIKVAADSKTALRIAKDIL